MKLKNILCLALVLACGGQYEEEIDELDNAEFAQTEQELSRIGDFAVGTNNSSTNPIAGTIQNGCSSGCAFVDGNSVQDTQTQRILRVCIPAGTHSKVRSAAKQFAADASSVGAYLAISVHEASSSSPCWSGGFNSMLTVTSDDTLSDPSQGDSVISRYMRLTFSNCQLLTETLPGSWSYCLSGLLKIDPVAIANKAPNGSTSTDDTLNIKQAVYAGMHAGFGFGMRSQVNSYVNSLFSTTTRALPNAFDHPNNSLRCQANSIPKYCIFGSCGTWAHNDQC